MAIIMILNNYFNAPLVFIRQLDQLFRQASKLHRDTCSLEIFHYTSLLKKTKTYQLLLIYTVCFKL